MQRIGGLPPHEEKKPAAYPLRGLQVQPSRRILGDIRLGR
jgi:hypothetical protein